MAIGLLVSSKEKSSSEDYFLAGRGLNWWLIGFSLIAANISAEQFVGMSGKRGGLDWPGRGQLRVDRGGHTGHCGFLLSAGLPAQRDLYHPGVPRISFQPCGPD